jgi:hypothetical protein
MTYNIDIGNRVDLCYQDELDLSLFDENLGEFLDSYSNSYRIGNESLLSGLLASVSSICAQSSIKLTDTWSDSLNLYVIISGYPGSNKSGCISLFKDGYEKMEAYLGSVMPPGRLNVHDTEQFINQMTNQTSDNINNSEGSESNFYLI